MKHTAAEKTALAMMAIGPSAISAMIGYPIYLIAAHLNDGIDHSQYILSFAAGIAALAVSASAFAWLCRMIAMHDGRNRDEASRKDIAKALAVSAAIALVASFLCLFPGLLRESLRLAVGFAAAIDAAVTVLMGRAAART